MQVLGHRGSRVPGPENTVDAVEAALRAGADGIEVDVRRSADGDLVCVHDARLPGRLTGRAVVRRSTRELADLGVPVLSDVLDAWDGRGRIILEVKNQPGQPDFDAPRERTAYALVELLRARGLGRVSRPVSPEAVTVSSFDWFAIEAVRDSGIGVATAFLSMPRMSVNSGIAYVRSAGHQELHAHVSSVLGSEAVPQRARAAGVGLVTWTVTSVADAGQLRDAGVDAAICDNPAEVVRKLGRGAA
ncbi:glycerophosphodiester phosphodiesterase [Frankia sp. Cppng1_Ct_nod]|uniref:glycerophosphodiester phosphodiesterase n=1 Tax=Frankia sp. Cppng1_Ct_nod TaxID=2897162 RepID=UPI001041B793|nr:glycerophosphodiester phosphodiesterase [Frankia sp. Cppng1_Ct_nod]